MRPRHPLRATHIGNGCLIHELDQDEPRAENELVADAPVPKRQRRRGELRMVERVTPAMPATEGIANEQDSPNDNRASYC